MAGMMVILLEKNLVIKKAITKAITTELMMN